MTMTEHCSSGERTWCEHVGDGPCVRCGRPHPSGSAHRDETPETGRLFADPELELARRRGEARAEADIAQGIADLRASAATAEEWSATAEIGDRNRRIEPKRQILNGMLRHLERNQQGEP